MQHTGMKVADNNIKKRIPYIFSIGASTSLHTITITHPLISYYANWRSLVPQIYIFWNVTNSWLRELVGSWNFLVVLVCSATLHLSQMYQRFSIWRTCKVNASPWPKHPSFWEGRKVWGSLWFSMRWKKVKKRPSIVVFLFKTLKSNWQQSVLYWVPCLQHVS